LILCNKIDNNHSIDNECVDTSFNFVCEHSSSDNSLLYNCNLAQPSKGNCLGELAGNHSTEKMESRKCVMTDMNCGVKIVQMIRLINVFCFNLMKIYVFMMIIGIILLILFII
jgi:hypothetical protein